jgi:hypothetical protein
MSETKQDTHAEEKKYKMELNISVKRDERLFGKEGKGEERKENLTSQRLLEC